MTNNEVNHPAHYTQGEIECIDAIRAALTPDEFRGYCKGNALKYIWRERHKGGQQDADKAAWYLAYLRGYDGVGFRHGDIDKVCGVPESGTGVPISGIAYAGEFTQPPNCAGRPGDLDELRRERNHPMRAVELEMADAAIANQTQPGEVGN